MSSFKPDNISEKLTGFLKNYFAKAGFNKAVIALSGGIDSATSCALAVRALGEDKVCPVLLPYGELNKQAVVDAKLVTNYLKIPESNITVIDIKPLIDPFISLDSAMSDIRKGNLMARVRMSLIFDQAKKFKALVVGTENKTVSHLPREIKLKYPKVPWSQIVGSRVRVAHEYFGIDLKIIWKTVQEDLPLLKNEVTKVIKEFA